MPKEDKILSNFEKENIEESKRKLIEKIKNKILKGNSEIGYVQFEHEERSFEQYYSEYRMPEKNIKIIGNEGDTSYVDCSKMSRPMPRNLFELGKEFGIGFPPDIRHYTVDHSPLYEVYWSDFKQEENCSEKQKNAISERRKKLEKFRKKVESAKDGRYDKPKKFSFPLYKTNDNAFNLYDKILPTATVSDTIEIELTQEELAKAGLLPEDFKWMEKARVSAKDIADADREQALTTSEVGGFKRFMYNLLDKFKGKGEK